VPNASRWKFRTKKNPQKFDIWAPSQNFVRIYIFATKARIHNLKKKLVKQQCLPPHVLTNYNMVNFGPLAAEIIFLVLGTSANVSGFRFLAALLHGTLVVDVSQTAALNRGHGLCSTGRPSRWALAHISSCGRPMWPLYFFSVVSIFLCSFFLFFPHLISAAADWMSTILRHLVWS